ncbi:hypothetical protein [Lapidilactobacillus luobeiensis]|uniref:hypothetical protein n=1 Tax=Lapidilactobacillus luobeiensis TaxID=2950371 RepID=UPI0021C35E61|nr:hypothetical protein [Lapidilactobacillus luobeiensis]
MVKKRNMAKENRIIMIILTLFLGILLGARGDHLIRTRIAKQARPTYEIVVPPTRKTKISYTEPKHDNIIATHTFPNPKKRLCVIIFNRTDKTGYYELRELRTKD